MPPFSLTENRSYSVQYMEDITRFPKDIEYSSGKNFSRVECSETSEMFWPREDKIYIFWKPCNVLFIIWAPNKRWFRKKNNDLVIGKFVTSISPVNNTNVFIQVSANTTIVNTFMFIKVETNNQMDVSLKWQKFLFTQFPQNNQINKLICSCSCITDFRHLTPLLFNAAFNNGTPARLPDAHFGLT